MRNNKVKKKNETSYRLFRLIKYTFITFIIIISIVILSNILSGKLVKYTKQKAINKSMEIVNNIINDEFLNSINKEKIIIDNEDNKTYVNTVEVNKIVKNVNRILNEKIEEYEYEKLFIPYVVLINELLLKDSKYGFYIKSKPISSYKTDILVESNEYGLNNSVINVYLKIDIKTEILFPTSNQFENVNMKIPITMIIVEGDIPNGIIYSN